jgi:hypothetical protein
MPPIALFIFSLSRRVAVHRGTISEVITLEATMNNRTTLSLMLGGLLLSLSAVTSAQAASPSISVAYQPMVSTGLAAKRPFEAWFVLDKSSDPTVPGYDVPAGATIRFTFPQEFTPQADLFQGAVMLSGWSQGSIPVKFTTTKDEANPRALVIKFSEPVTAGPPEKPGLKAIHLRVRVLNPATAGDYPIAITFTDAGALSGTTTAVAHITPTPVPNVAAYNELNQGRGSNWQHVMPGQGIAVPIDFLVTLPRISRSLVNLTAEPDGSMRILSDGKRIGSIKAQGVPITMTPEAFGPGKSRLGIIRVHVKAGSEPGVAEIIAALDGGTQYKINLVVGTPSQTSSH